MSKVFIACFFFPPPPLLHVQVDFSIKVCQVFKNLLNILLLSEVHVSIEV